MMKNVMERIKDSLQMLMYNIKITLVHYEVVSVVKRGPIQIIEGWIKIWII